MRSYLAVFPQDRFPAALAAQQIAKQKETCAWLAIGVHTKRGGNDSILRLAVASLDHTSNHFLCKQHIEV